MVSHVRTHARANDHSILVDNDILVAGYGLAASYLSACDES